MARISEVKDSSVSPEKPAKQETPDDTNVTDKPANKPFLVHKRYREKQEALHAAWVERQKEREEKIARGEKVGPPEPDPTAPTEIGIGGLLKFIVFTIIFLALAGKFITGSYTWEYESKWTQLKTYLPKPNQRLFSERLLAEFDGSSPGKPIYLGIDGDVYDVSEGNAYKPGGSYAILAGVDAARAFGTGCFKEHRTYDIRGMSDSEMRSLEHWKGFYAGHQTYTKIGRVVHQPIDPASPIPKHCDPKKEAAAQAAREKVAGPQAKPKPGSDHTEL